MVDSKEWIKALREIETIDKLDRFAEIDNWAISKEMYEVVESLEIMRLDFLDSHFIDNPKPNSHKKWNPWETIKSQNINVMALRFNSGEYVIIDGLEKYGSVIWRQLGKEDDIVDLKELLSRVSQLSINYVDEILINNIIIIRNLFNNLQEELESTEFSVNDPDLSGLGVLSIPIIHFSKKLKYNVSVQFGKISLWKNSSVCLVDKTTDPNEVTEYLLIEALNDIYE